MVALMRHHFPTKPWWSSLKTIDISPYLRKLKSHTNSTPKTTEGRNLWWVGRDIPLLAHSRPITFEMQATTTTTIILKQIFYFILLNNTN